MLSVRATISYDLLAINLRNSIELCIESKTSTQNAIC